jgi:hypothetical protein
MYMYIKICINTYTHMYTCIYVHMHLHLHEYVHRYIFIYIGSSAKLFNLLGTVKSGAKLEFLVVCRFAKLSIDEQSLARTASIIGTYGYHTRFFLLIYMYVSIYMFAYIHFCVIIY